MGPIDSRLRRLTCGVLRTGVDNDGGDVISFTPEVRFLFDTSIIPGYAYRFIETGQEGSAVVTGPPPSCFQVLLQQLMLLGVCINSQRVHSGCSC